jgi:nucleotide-binding universal stress UspA family protein
VLVGITGTQPGTVARTPEAFAEELEAYAGEVAARCGTPVRATPLVLHDVTADLDRALIAQARELDADLIVMASHIPGALEHVIASNAGYVASHTSVSVFVVRG